MDIADHRRMIDMSKADHKLVAFWPYDQFPYTLHGVITNWSAETGHAYVESYQSSFKTFAVLAEPAGTKLANEIDQLSKNYQKELRELANKYNKCLEDTFTNYGVHSHPTLKYQKRT